MFFITFDKMIHPPSPNLWKLVDQNIHRFAKSSVHLHSILGQNESASFFDALGTVFANSSVLLGLLVMASGLIMIIYFALSDKEKLNCLRLFLNPLFYQTKRSDMLSFTTHISQKKNNNPNRWKIISPWLLVCYDIIYESLYTKK